MTSILKKTAPSLTLRAGKLAREKIQQDGFYAQDVDILPGAAGGPKGIGLQGLDIAIFDDFLPTAPKRRHLIGASIGSWRFASILAHGAKKGTARLADHYTDVYFDKKMTMAEIDSASIAMLNSILDGREQQVLQHPDYHLVILATQAKKYFASDAKLPLMGSLASIFFANTLNRQYLNYFMQRSIIQPNHTSHLKFDTIKDFKPNYYDLNPHNLQAWLMASASIPAVMSGIHNIDEHARGTFRDGGLIDYHLDLPYTNSGIVLYPHYQARIVPGWFDKFAPWHKVNQDNQAQTLLVAPSAEFLASLPLKRLPDRKDFVRFSHDQSLRKKLWRQTIAESQRMGDEFLELVEKQHFANVIQDLK